MIVIAARMIGKPERKADILRLVAMVAQPSRAEAGCIAYNFYEKQPAASEFLFFEEWADQAALDLVFQDTVFSGVHEANSRVDPGTAQNTPVRGRKVARPVSTSATRTAETLRPSTSPGPTSANLIRMWSSAMKASTEFRTPKPITGLAALPSCYFFLASRASVRPLLQILANRPRRSAPEDHALAAHHFLARNPALRPQDYARLDANVVGQAHLSADDHAVFQHRAAADAGLRGHHHVASDVHVVATCTRLSSFTPSPITVASSAPRSTVVLAPISTSLPISSRPIWGNLW